MSRKINETLLELIAGIFIAGIVIQLIKTAVAVLNPALAGARLTFSLGLWIGVATAIGLSIHMYRSIDYALDLQADDAE